MAKQTAPIRKTCQHRSQCVNDAIIGTYTWVTGRTDVNLDRPVKVFCGQHKPQLHGGYNFRNVKLVR